MYKYPKKFPFRLAATSFIYPDKIIPNVMKLGSFFDEIELLLFESKPFIVKDNINGSKIVEVLPSKEEIKELGELSKKFDLTYNIHLPVDISLTDSSKSVRLESIETVKKVVALCEPLNPTTYTLHLDFNINGDNPQNNLAIPISPTPAPSPMERGINTPSLPLGRAGEGQNNYLESYINLEIWREYVKDSLQLLSSSLSDPSIISIETLDYPFEYIGDIVESCKMSVCIDAGHLIKYGYSIEKLFAKYKAIVPIIHLHGVEFPSLKDHQPLGKTPSHILEPTMNVLKNFKGVVSLELFNYEHLSKSLEFLNQRYNY
ncbi:MAG: sugar phosphate isomerase/epimerase [Desulfamplus sp.]|nr:sugar phosphate isomerase/epimerase [Desulfamplus sp.]